MKYPQLVSMPSAVSNWLEEQLEARGLDASVYARYILSLLHSDAVDVICSDDDLHFSHLKKELSRRSGGGRKRLRRSSDWWSDALANAEKLKRSAAIECLMSASEQTSSFESLIDELCEKLKQVDTPSVDQPLLRKPKQDNQQLSFQELANRYYAAFPPLDRKNSLSHQQAVKWSTPSKMDNNITKSSNLPSNPSSEDGIPDLPTRISLGDNRMDVGVILGQYQHSRDDLRGTFDSLHGSSSSDSGSVSSREHEELVNLGSVVLPLPNNRFARHRNWGEENQRRYTETYDGEAYEVYDHRYSPNKNRFGAEGASQENLGISDESCEAYDHRYSTEKNKEVYEAYDHRYSNTEIEHPYEQTFMAVQEMQSQPARRNLGVVGGPVPEICFSCNKIHDDDEPSMEDQIACQMSLMLINHSPQTSAFVKTKQNVRKCLFPPKEATLPRTPVMSSIRDTPLRTIESSDDLLTSSNTHFCPIKMGAPIFYRGDYPDGATFTVNNNLDKVDYKRSESGSMYVENGRKYRELGRTRNLSTFWDYDNNLVLKFEVKSNDKSIQTEKVQYEIGYKNQLQATEEEPFEINEPEENNAMNTDYSTDESSKGDAGDESPLSPLSEVLQELPWKQQDQGCSDHDVCGHFEEIWKANEASEWPGWNMWTSREKRTENAGDLAHEELKGDLELDGDQLLSDLEAHLRNFATEAESPDTEDSGWCEESVDLMESQRSVTLDHKDSLVWLLQAPLTPNQPSSITEQPSSITEEEEDLMTWDVPESRAVTF